MTANSRPARALVIDDSRSVRQILSKLLREFGFEVTEASDGQEALERLADLDSPPQVALINWEMPRLDGVQFIRAARALSTMSGVPLLMVSGIDDPLRIAEARAAGADAYLVKPCDRERLQNALRQLRVLPQLEPTVEETESAFDVAAVPTELEAATSAAASISRVRSLPPTTTSPAAQHIIRILLVDDSGPVRRILTQIISSDAGLAVAAQAADGVEALERLAAGPIDVVILDVEMPRMDGLATLKEIRTRYPRMPVIMFSSLTERGAIVTTEALLRGADDFVTKPGGPAMTDPLAGRRVITEKLLPRIHEIVAARSAAARLPSVASPPRRPEAVRRESAGPSLPTRVAPIGQRIAAIAIGVSTGGPPALDAILRQIPRPLHVPVLIVQHMPAGFTGHLARRLAEQSGLVVREAVDGEPIAAGEVLIAPGGRHLVLAREAGSLRARVNDDPPVNACRPSVDRLLISCAEHYGSGLLAVILTGMGHDGLQGCRAVRERGGIVIAQDEASSIVWGMPGAVVRAGLAESVLSLERIGPSIGERLR